MYSDKKSDKVKTQGSASAVCSKDDFDVQMDLSLLSQRIMSVDTCAEIKPYIVNYLCVHCIIWIARPDEESKQIAGSHWRFAKKTRLYLLSITQKDMLLWILLCRRLILRICSHHRDRRRHWSANSAFYPKKVQRIETVLSQWRKTWIISRSSVWHR